MKRIMQGSRRPATLIDVAALAGVAPITVSRAIRMPEKVSVAVRRRIVHAIEKVGYVPNQVAGSLASNRTNLVVALIPNIGNPLFASTIHGLTDVLHEHGLHLAIGNTGHSLIGEEALIAAFLAKRPCGMLLHRTTHSRRARRLLIDSGVAVVETGNLLRQPIDSSVSYSSFAAAKALTLHVLELGYRRIAFVGSPNPERTEVRQHGYRAAFKELGLAIDPALMIKLPHTSGAGAEAIGDLLERTPQVDCVLFSGIASAIGAVLECQRRSVAVPKRIAIATFDDNELAQQVLPPLTALRIPRYEIGRRAGQIIVDWLSGTPREGRSVDLGFKIIRRGST
jgi:LacI family gluconate utilization system Gnt-I transcriptional repressor